MPAESATAPEARPWKWRYYRGASLSWIEGDDMAVKERGQVPVREGFFHAQDPDVCRNGFDAWDRLREETPSFESTYRTPGSPNPLWYLLGYDDVYTVLRDTNTFSSRGLFHPDYESEYLMIPAEYDPPLHTKYRTLMNPLLSPSRVESLEPKIRSVCRALVDELADRGECDIVTDFALRFPTTVFVDMLGVAADDMETFIEWVHQSQHTSHLEDPDGKIRDGADRAIHEYMLAVADERQANPRDDMVSELVRGTVDGRPLDRKELGGMLYLLFLAGLDTVASMLGFSFVHLAQRADDRQRLCEDPTLVPSAVEEMLRYYSIVNLPRNVTSDVERGGCPMHEGDRVFVIPATANRDPRAFPDADRFVIDRSPNRHLAFGAGPHRCVGSHLARKELAVALEEWHKTIPDYELPTGFEPELRVGMSVTSLISVPLRWADPD